MKNYSASIALTKLKHVREKRKGKSGEVEGIFIPIKINHLIEGKEKDGVKPLYLNLGLAFREEDDENGNIGFVKHKGDQKGKKWKELTKEEQDEINDLPYLGNIKDWSKGRNSDDAEGDAGGGKVFDGTDDLPF